MVRAAVMGTIHWLLRIFGPEELCVEFRMTVGYQNINIAEIQPQCME